MKTWTLFLTAALSAVCIAQKDCWHGACYPPTGDLLMGREQNLRASSTCGLMGSEVVCTPHANTMKCCPCDSRYPAAYNAHTIQNVLSSAGPTRWWQSKKDVNPVSIQLDLNGIYQLETLFLSFKGPRPEALIIERTKDFGRTWQPALYLAADCPSTFPWVDTTLPRTLDGTYCFTLPSTDDNPYRDQKVHYYPLRQFANIDLPNDYKIEVASGFTGLRVNLTQLGHVPSMPGRSLSQFYALREMRVIGSCFCHGHANRCLPDTTNNIKVGGTCDCQHNTAGVNCERCDDFFNDLPWRPAENSNPHTCKRCDCNNHSDRCHFDPLRYEETGRRSGGVCDACMHHTTGPNCERCAPNYYSNPLSDMRSPDACLRCQCNSAGSLNSGQCDAVTGQCLCKAHVEGANCDRCKHGYYNLNANNPSGCSSCQCNFAGSLNSGQCDAVTGQCLCKAHVEGTKCDRCRPGYHNLNTNDPSGCSSCQCNSAGSLNFGQCDAGQCLCKPHVEGAKCDRCKPGYYNLNANNPSGCSSCQCNSAGSLNFGQCDAGQCLCKAHVEGAKCDRCKPGYYNLNANNPSGCSSCQCNSAGSLNFGQCDAGQCLCKAHVEGAKCDRCKPGYYNLNANNPSGCSSCQCNSAGSLNFGQCDAGQCLCKPHVEGAKCDRCKPGYYNLNANNPSGCSSCQCNSAGSLNSGQCDAGQCLCKAHVEGAKCDRCKPGYYNLDPNNPSGCSKCLCSTEGSLSSVCDQLTGQCLCRPHVEGLVCDRCSNGYWNLKSPNSCQPCDCDPKNARSTTCDQFTGQCQCRYSFGGRTCSGCPDNTYGNHLIGCRPCDCDPSGTELGGCDKLTGLCRCKPGVTGARCDSCKSGHCDSFPQCPACPSCIFTMNTELQNLTLLLEHLSNNRIPESTSEEVNRKFRRLQITLTKIQESMFVPPSSSDTLIQTLKKLDTLRTQMNGLTKDLSPQPSDPDLKKRLDELEELMSSIRLEYLAKRDAIKNIDTSNNTGAYNAIQNSYDTSTDALKKAEAAQVPLKKLTETRDKAIKDLNRVQPANTKDLLKLKEDLATRPDLTPAAEKVCGSTRVEPCTPQQCTGDVCPPAGAPPCGPEETCIGALPNANKAFQNAEEMKDKLRDLNDKIAKALTQIQEADDSANKVRLSTDKLANQIKQVRDDVDGDLKDAKDFISTLKDYLSAPHSDPDEVQRICENVLEAKLPINVENLKKKLKEMQDLASSLPDSSKVLESTKPELEKARKLLEEAQKTRDAAFGILNDTESIQKSLDEDEPVLDDLEKKIQKSLDIAKNVKENVEKIEDTLAPVEKGIEGITGLVDEMRPLLDTLKKDIQTGTGLADDAQDKADEAQDEADQAAKDLEALKDEIEKLKVAAEANSEAGEVGDRLKKLQDEASTLVSDTANITTALRDKEAEIKKGTEELLKNADRLSGLEAKLEILRENIRQKVTGLNLCQG